LFPARHKYFHMPFLIVLIKNTFLQALISLIIFPFWWYTIGLKERFFKLIKGIRNLAHNLALKIMFTYLFKPMFGEFSWSGRIISFFMRLILLFWRLFLFILGLAGQLLFFVIWIALPILAVWQIFVLNGF